MAIPVQNFPLASNKFFGPVMQAVDMMVNDKRQKDAENRQMVQKREYWKELEKRSNRDRAFKTLFGMANDATQTENARQTAFGAVTKGLQTGEFDATGLMPEYKKPKEETPKFDFNKFRAEEYKRTGRDPQGYYPGKGMTNSGAGTTTKDNIIRDISSKISNAMALSKSGSQNFDANTDTYSKTSVNRKKYAKYIKLMETLKDKKASGKWTDKDQKFYDKIQEYDYYESSGDDIPEFGKPVSDPRDIESLQADAEAWMQSKIDAGMDKETVFKMFRKTKLAKKLGY